MGLNLSNGTQVPAANAVAFGYRPETAMGADLSVTSIGAVTPA